MAKQHMDMNAMMKQAQQMRKDLAKAEESLAAEEVTATSGGGMVSVTITGTMNVKEIKIDPAAINPEDTEMLGDMICAAVNEGIRQAKELSEEQLGGLTGGLNIPGLF